MKTIDFKTDCIGPHCQGRMDISQDSIRLITPSTILGFISTGEESQTIDVRHIVSVSSEYRYMLGAMLIFAFLGIMILPFGFFLRHIFLRRVF